MRGTPGEREALEARLREKFKDDGLHRLVNANQDYYLSHGDYVPELAQLLLFEREAVEQLTKERDEEKRVANSAFGKAEQYLQLSKLEAKRVEQAQAQVEQLTKERDDLKRAVDGASFVQEQYEQQVEQAQAQVEKLRDAVTAYLDGAPQSVLVAALSEQTKPEDPT